MRELGHRDRDDSPVEDDIVVLHSVSWAEYLRKLDERGDRSGPRISYNEGELEIMSPSKTHESIKSKIGRLVEVWCLEKGVRFETLGAWTINDERVQRGAEPDECWVFGDRDLEKAERPDLAVEVEWTRGGLDKLDIYRKLSVREVWMWRKKQQLTVHVLRGERYVEVPKSTVLKGIDLAELVKHLGLRTSDGIRAYRAALTR